MSKTLWIGPAGCGKTDLLLNEFDAFLQTTSDPLAPDAFFIVPSLEHTERVISLLVQRGVKGFFHKRVTTLSRLVNDLFRITDIPVASSLTRALIVKDLLKVNNWDYFSEVRDHPGFLSLALQFVSELKEACLTPEVFRARMNALKSFEPAYAAKYEALAALYEQYDGEIRRRGLRDEQDALRLFRERKGRNKVLPRRLKALWVDGFFDFSNLQKEYLQELSALTDAMTVTLTREDGPGWEGAFEAVAGTQQSLAAMEFKVRKMKAYSHRTQKPALLFLQRNLFSPKVPTDAVPDPQRDIVCLDAVGIDGEIELIAREIHRLYASGNYRYSDFAVLFRQIKNYTRVLAAIFERYGIPAEIHERERLKFSPWIASVVSLLSLFRNGWKREDLFGFLKSGYVRACGAGRPKQEEWIAKFEQRAFQEGVTEGREAWVAEWKGRGTEDLAGFNSEKEEILQSLTGLEEAFRAAQSSEEHARILRRAVYHTFQILEISDAYTPSVRREAACVRRFEALLDEMRGHFLKYRTPAVAFDSFSDYFLGLVELDLYSVHERDKNRVQIYDVSLARQKEYKVVFVAGLLERVFPMQVREDPLLSDWERKLMNGGMDLPLAERLPRQSIEKLFFYYAVTRARELLYLSYPHLDFEGKEALPSFYWEEVQALFNGKITVIRQNLARPYPALEEAITPREQEAAVLGALRTVSGNEIPAEGPLMRALEKVLAQPESRSRIFESLKPIEAKLLDERIREGRYLKISETSPTRLEQYAKCPYRYFADRVLRLRDATEDKTVMQKGNILHSVLQRYFDPRMKKNAAEDLETFVRRELGDALEKYPIVWSDPYRETLDRKELFEMLFYFLRDEEARLGSSGFKPAYVEYSFGSAQGSDAPPLEIPGDGQNIRLQGRIDRIDTDKDRKEAVVVDYKRSASFKAGDLALGTALQLPLYLLAASRHLKLAPLGGEIYSIKDRKRSGFYCEDRAASYGKEFSPRSQVPGAEFQKILDRAVAFVQRFTKSIESLEIPVKPRECVSFCPYTAVCRIEKWKLPIILEEIRKEDEAAGLAGEKDGNVPSR